jgi:phosphatidylserine/phosphatidylglycerophosphate/cardiolipin synthase-like enzyme
MSRRNRDSRSRLFLLLIVGFLILVGVLYGPQTAIDLVFNALGLESTPAAVHEEYAGTGEYYDVYFTNPVIPFDGVVTGGVDRHLVALIDAAETSVDAAMFEFNLQSVADALIRAHERGVAVRVVYDDEHTQDDPQIGQLQAAGIPTTPDGRSAFMHDKFFVFDGGTVWTGSTNITENGVYRNNNNAIVIRSPAVAANYQSEFEEMFGGAFGPSSPPGVPNPTVEIGAARVDTLFGPEDPVIDRLIAIVNGAQTSIRFMAFSFTEDALGEAMRGRAAAGVDVAGVFETRGANTEYSECPPMLAAGLDVRLDGNPRVLHHKVIVVDDQIVAVGSFNFSDNAAESNDENLLIIYDPSVAILYRQEFDRRQAEARPPVGGECLSGEGDE